MYIVLVSYEETIPHSMPVLLLKFSDERVCLRTCTYLIDSVHMAASSLTLTVCDVTVCDVIFVSRFILSKSYTRQLLSLATKQYDVCT